MFATTRVPVVVLSFVVVLFASCGAGDGFATPKRPQDAEPSLLGGTVAESAGRLVAVQLDTVPEGLKLRPFVDQRVLRFAIAGAQGEADVELVVQRFDPNRMRVYGEVVAGDAGRKIQVGERAEAVGLRDVLLHEVVRLRVQLAKKDLLLQACQSYQITDMPDAPTLVGSVAHASGRLLTVVVSENPDDVDIAEAIERMPFRFAICDDKGVYKGDAVAQKYDAASQRVLCKLVIKTDDAVIEVGDRAATNP